MCIVTVRTPTLYSRLPLTIHFFPVYYNCGDGVSQNVAPVVELFVHVHTMPLYNLALFSEQIYTCMADSLSTLIHASGSGGSKGITPSP